MRILVLSHGHPAFSPGGGERAAYALFQHLKAAPGVTQVVFAARAEAQAIGHDACFGSFRGRSDEILVATPPVDGFTFQSLGYDVLKRLVADLVQTVRPDVVHIHHFIFWGVEIVELFKQAGVRVVFTLHEFAAICAQYGQMVKANGQLCHAASPGECGLCFPMLSAGKFFIRNTIMTSLLSAVDHFIAPSDFLKERYTAWGIPDEQISTVENVLDPFLIEQSEAQTALRQTPKSASVHKRKTVFGFFASITPFKGFDLLLEAASLLPEEVRQQVTIRIHGENTHYRNTEFHDKTQALLSGVREVVSVMGAYRGDDVIHLMRACDWIVVPSIWWENSPVVIQEARLAARPLIVSNIGGMAEKVDPTVDRLFPARSPGALADVITEIVRGQEPLDHKRLRNLAQARAQADRSHGARHRDIYQRALTGGQPIHRMA